MDCSYCDDAYDEGYSQGYEEALFEGEERCRRVCGLCGIWEVDTQSCFYYPRCTRFESCEHWEEPKSPPGADWTRGWKLKDW